MPGSHLADGNHVHAEGVLVVVGVAVHVVADELLAVHVLDGDHGLEELHQLLGVGLGGEVEVQPLVVGFDAHTILWKKKVKNSFHKTLITLLSFFSTNSFQ